MMASLTTFATGTFVDLGFWGVGGIVARGTAQVTCPFIVALRGLVAYVPTLETPNRMPTATLPTSASVAILVVVGWRVVPHSTEFRVIKQENVPGKSSIQL